MTEWAHCQRQVAFLYLCALYHFLVYDSMVSDIAMEAALTRTASASGSSIMSGEAMMSQDSIDAKAGGDRVSRCKG